MGKALYGKRDLALARELGRQARQAAQTVIDRDRDPDRVAQATKLLDEMETENDMKYTLTVLGGAPLPPGEVKDVTPTLGCVTKNPDGTSTATMGYINQSLSNVMIPV